ncbi:hypothetical protein BVX98_00280 [bacterium F11]|nr:hypothetical protein BVX98_00280 [bacterium F11]
MRGVIVKNILRWLGRRRVAVLKGGWSRERAISLKTGQAVEQAFRRLGVRFASIDVQGNIEEVLKKKNPHFAFLCLHGTFGEDGQVQNLLDRLKILYNGSGALASSLAMNKASSKALLQEIGVPTPPWVLVSKNWFLENSMQASKEARRLLAKGPVFIKPVDQGSAIGVTQVTRPHQLSQALTTCFSVSDQALVEGFIKGRELTVGILGSNPLPVVEIVPEHSFYDYHSKYAKGGSRHLVPAHLSVRSARLAQKLALKTFRGLGCSAYGRVDIMMRPNGQMMVLEMNTLPGLTKVSLLPDAARASGIPFDELVLRIVAHSVDSIKGFR